MIDLENEMFYDTEKKIFTKNNKPLGSRTQEGDINILYKGKRQKAHRVAFELEKGEFKDKYAYKEFKDKFNLGYFERGE